MVDKSMFGMLIMEFANIRFKENFKDCCRHNHAFCELD